MVDSIRRWIGGIIISSVGVNKKRGKDRLDFCGTGLCDSVSLNDSMSTEDKRIIYIWTEEKAY